MNVLLPNMMVYLIEKSIYTEKEYYFSYIKLVNRKNPVIYLIDEHLNIDSSALVMINIFQID